MICPQPLRAVLHVLGCACLLVLPAQASVVEGQGFDGSKPMNITATELMYEQDVDRVTAIGAVNIEQEGRVLTANRVAYDIKSDKVTAEGNVVLTEPSGDVHKAEYVVMEDAFKEGFVRGMSSILKDGSRVTAQEGTRVNADKIVLKNAWYTPCKPCQDKPNETPDWNVKAEEVTLDEANHRVVYKNAKFELFGVPVLYTPYLSHPDGTEKQKSGFLPPRFGFGSQLGAFVESKYYHAISPSKDATVGAILTSKEGPVATGEYRQRFENAEMSIGGSVTNSTRPYEENGNDVRANETVRGNLTGKGRWDIDNKWRAGYKVDVASDDQYLRQYKLPNEDVLENRLYAERFDQRDYASVQALAFQDTRLTRDTIDQPHVVPWIEAEHLTDPKSVLGGRAKFIGSTVGLVRDGSGQDMQRFSGEAQWNRRAILPGGLVSDTDALLRGDAYHTESRFAANTLPGQGRSDTTTREINSLEAGTLCQQGVVGVDRANHLQWGFVLEGLAKALAGCPEGHCGHVPVSNLNGALMSGIHIATGVPMSGAVRLNASDKR